jgi:hypothetical protein
VSLGFTLLAERILLEGGRKHVLMNSLRSLAFVSAVLGFLLLTVQGAAATPFTLAAPVVINDSGVVGTINPVASFTGSLGLTSGATDPVANDVFIVDLTLAGGSALIGAVTITTVTAFFEPIGAGAFDDAGTAPTAVSYVPLDFAFLGGYGVFDFTGDTIDAGETTVRLFVTSTLGLLADNDPVAFMISSGADFSVFGSVVAIPEPSAVTLLASGLLILGVESRRRSLTRTTRQ